MTPSKNAPYPLAPEWTTSDWLNASSPLTLASHRGKVVLLHAFQMLCPGCILHGLPQAQRVAEAFADEPVAVVGLHSVFEHHDAMQPHALRAFAHEFRLRFPIGVDAPGLDGDPTPRTMGAYQLRGTPSTILIDAEGRVRRHIFGAHDDLRLGSELRSLLVEARPSSPRLPKETLADDGQGCAGGACEKTRHVNEETPRSAAPPGARRGSTRASAHRRGPLPAS